MSLMAHLRLWLMGLAASTIYGATLQKDVAGISVVVPCYNHGSTLKRALDSIVVSAYHLQEWLEARGEPKHSVQMEIVVVDDNSTDSTAQVAAQFKKQSDLPLKVKVRRHEWGEQHAGPDPRKRRPGAARNFGVRHARGSVLLYLDADDVYHADHIARIYAPLVANHSIGFVKTRMEFQVPMHPHWGDVIEHVSPINGGVRRDLHELIGGYPDLDDGEDASYWNMIRAVAPGVEPKDGDTPTCVYVLTPGNHLETQRDKFSHPPEDRDRFEEPKRGDYAENRRQAEKRFLGLIRSKIRDAATMGSAPRWLSPGAALNNIGRMFQQLLEWDEAQQSYIAAVQVDPKNAEGFYSMGVLYGKAGHPENAEGAYKRAVELDAAHANSWYNMGVLQRDSGREKDAEASYRAAIAAEDDHSEARNGLATLLWNQGRVEEAEGHFKTGLSYAPEDAKLNNNLGGLYVKMKKYKKAEYYFKAALEADPDHPQARANLDALKNRKKNDL